MEKNVLENIKEVALEDLTVAELKEMAAAEKMEFNSKVTKAELIEMLTPVKSEEERTEESTEESTEAGDQEDTEADQPEEDETQTDAQNSPQDEEVKKDKIIGFTQEPAKSEETKNTVVFEKGQRGYINGRKYKVLANGVGMWASDGSTFLIKKEVENNA